MKASPISWEETRARRRLVTPALSPGLTGSLPQTLSATNSRIASATLVDAAMPATQAAKEEPVPSASSHMARNPSMTRAPTDAGEGEVDDECWTWRGSNGSAIAATKRLALPSK